MIYRAKVAGPTVTIEAADRTEVLAQLHRTLPQGHVPSLVESSQLLTKNGWWPSPREAVAWLHRTQATVIENFEKSLVQQRTQLAALAAWLAQDERGGSA